MKNHQLILLFFYLLMFSCKSTIQVDQENSLDGSNSLDQKLNAQKDSTIDLVNSKKYKIDSLMELDSIPFDLLMNAYNESDFLILDSLKIETKGYLFINRYVNLVNNSKDHKSEIKWIKKQSILSKKYLNEYLKLMNSDIDYNPIFNAQDYPEKGFKIKAKSSNSLITQGIDWPDFQLKITFDDNSLIDSIERIKVVYK